MRENLRSFILADSSLHHAIETLSPEQKDRIKDKINTMPGLSLNPNTKNPKKIVQNLLSEDLKDKKDIVIFQDVLNNSISKHDSNNFRALSVLELIETLKNLQDKLCALVYCQRNRTPYNFEDLKVLQTDHDIKAFSIVKDFISVKKQKDPEILKQFKALHQSPELELKKLDLVLRKENQLSTIIDKADPNSQVSVPVRLPREPPPLFSLS